MKTGGKWWPGLAGMLGLALALAAGEVRGQGQFQGADAVLKRITGAAQAPAEKTESAAEKLGKDIKAFGTGATKLPPADAAKQWLALMERYLALPAEQSRQFNPRDRAQFQLLIASLPPPAAWDDISKSLGARPAGKGKTVLREIALKLLGSSLTGNEAGFKQAGTDLDALVAKADERTQSMLGYQVQELRKALTELTGDTSAELKELERELALAENDSNRGYGYINVPDLITMVGEEKARGWLKRILSTRSQLQLYEADETTALARKMALEMINELKSAPWELTHDVGATALYEALDKKFGQAKTNNVTDPALRMELQMSNRDQGREEAKVYYLLGLIVQNRTDDAVKQAKSMGARTQGYLNPRTIESLTKAGHGKAAFDFFEKLLTENPDLSFWQELITLGAQTGQSDRTLALTRAVSARPGLSQARRTEVQTLLYQALLAADKVDEGVALLRTLIAAKAEGNDKAAENDEEETPGSGVSMVGRRGDQASLALNMAELGRLLKQPALVDEGLKRVRELLKTPVNSRISYERQSVEQSLMEFLSRIDRGPEGEAMLADKLAEEGKAPVNNQNRYMFGRGNQTLTDLATLYYRAGRHADVLALMDRAPGWGVKDVLEVNIQGSYFGGHHQEPLPVSVMAATALAETGREADARRIIRSVLYEHGGLDAAYALLVKLDGQQATAFLDELYARDTYEERPLIWKARLQRLAGKLDDSERTARQAISVDPSDGEQGKGDRMRVYAELAETLAAKGDNKQADFFREVVKAIRLAEDADDYYAAGLLTRGVKMYGEALNHFADAYCIQSRMAVQLSQMGLHEEAEKHYLKAYELMPDSFGRVESHCFGCEGAFNGEQAQSLAEKVFTQLAVKTPEKPQVHYLLGYLRQAQGRSRDALPAFRKAVELDPQYLNAWLKISELGHRMKLPATETEAVALNILRLDPLQRHAQANLAGVRDLRKLWAVAEGTVRYYVEPPKELYPLAASKAKLEQTATARKNNPEPDYTEFISYNTGRNSAKSPGQAVSQTHLMQSISQVVDQQAMMSGFDW